MSTEIDPPSPQVEGLQFERAEFDAPPAPMTCPSCQRPIEGEYFAINGVPCCETCRDGIQAQLRGGSGVARILRAMVLGGGAAVIAAIGYASFIHFLHLDWSLISILVGFFIGKSVRKGSSDRGGVVYQILAVVLTYFSIALTYTAVAVAQLQGQAQEAPADPAAPVVAPGPVVDAPAEAPEAVPGPVVDAPAELPKAEAPRPAVAPAPEAAAPQFDGMMLVLFLAALVTMLVQIPVLFMRESPITVLIVGFALWEAWKLNKRFKLEISGPYRIGGPQVLDGGEGVAHA